MHHLYHTEAFVIGSIPRSETAVSFLLLTKEYGLIYASAQGIRSSASKLKYALQLYSLAEVTLVRGKAGWKITTALPLANIYYLFVSEPRLQTLFARVFLLTRRLVLGEEASRLFVICRTAVAFCEKNKISEDEIRWLEVLLVIRILHELGYVGELPKDISLNHEDWSSEHLSKVSSHHLALVEVINQAIEESQL